MAKVMRTLKRKESVHPISYEPFGNYREKVVRILPNSTPAEHTPFHFGQTRRITAS
jgi:hypothetical protein